MNYENHSTGELKAADSDGMKKVAWIDRPGEIRRREYLTDPSVR